MDLAEESLSNGSPRERIGTTLTGDVLEVGPGHIPFPTAPGARVVFADRSVPGGRDATWPELVGAPHGPDAEFDLNLDVDGLAGIEDQSLDAVIAAHVIEHLANPIGALQEFERVLRPGGRLVLVVPYRSRTFDSVRPTTTLAHVLAEHDAGVTEVDEQHIREFCTAIFEQPPIHPPEVRAWHDPDALDAARFDLHRRRSIHVHCWDAEDFASLVAGTLAAGTSTWTLVDLYLADDFDGPERIEFGLVLERPGPADGGIDGRDRAERFIRRWTDLVLADPRRDTTVVSRFAGSLHRDLPSWPDLASLPATVLAEQLEGCRVAASELGDELERSRVALAMATDRAAEAVRQREELRASRSFRAGQALALPFRLARRRS